MNHTTLFFTAILFLSISLNASRKPRKGNLAHRRVQQDAQTYDRLAQSKKQFALAQQRTEDTLSEQERLDKTINMLCWDIQYMLSIPKSQSHRARRPLIHTQFCGQ